MALRIGVAAAALSLLAESASAQSVLDRTVGSNLFGRPMEFRAFTLHQLGAFAQAAGVPIGFEGMPAPIGSGSRTPIVLTGRTVREAVGLMKTVDDRYSCVEEDGVLVFRLIDRETGAPQMSPLDADAPPVRLPATTAREALGLVAALLGAPRTTAVQFSDTKAFLLDTPEGTVRSLLNSIVRSHGQLVWVFEWTRGSKAMFPYNLHFMSGLHGWGLGLTGVRPAEPVDLARFARTAAPAANVADVVVGTRGDGYPLVLTGMGSSAARDLAAATGVPFGMQATPGPSPERWSAPEFTATGRTLREVLEILAATDRRYSWRVLDGMIVIRPISSWSDSSDPLFALVPAVHLEEVTMTEAVRKVVLGLGAPDQTYSTFPDSKTVSLSAGPGSALDLLTALVKAHGTLTWTFEDGDPDQVRNTGLRHRLILGVPGGVGLGVPVR